MKDEIERLTLEIARVTPAPPPRSGTHPAVRAYHQTLSYCGSVTTTATRRLTAQLHAAADALGPPAPAE